MDVKYGKGVFPWLACGRSLTLGRDEGITKVMFDPNRRIESSAAASSAPVPATSSPKSRWPSRWVPTRPTSD